MYAGVHISKTFLNFKKIKFPLDKWFAHAYNMCCVQRQQVSLCVNPAESAVLNMKCFSLFVSLCANSVFIYSLEVKPKCLTQLFWSPRRP